VKVTDTLVKGISSFYRVGDLTLKILNNSAIISKIIIKNLNLFNFHLLVAQHTDMEVGTQEIQGKTKWEVAIAKGMITRRGKMEFSMQHIKVFFTITQPMDLSQRLKINDLQLDLGNIQIK
jgi:hypothetical protein